MNRAQEPLGRKRRRRIDLIRRVRAIANWDDLELPRAQLKLLRRLTKQVAARASVYEEWGTSKRAHGGAGIAALFTGPWRTGKVRAAEAIAIALDRGLYRIDLSAIVSKYIGETEKNLRRIFLAAERAGAVLLFDEADELFGKRGDVRDAHDRYANVEVACLLERMERYGGLSILATNSRRKIDPAFLRRVTVVVPFSKPPRQKKRRTLAVLRRPRESPRRARRHDR